MSWTKVLADVEQSHQCSLERAKPQVFIIVQRTKYLDLSHAQTALRATILFAIRTVFIAKGAWIKSWLHCMRLRGY